MPGHNEHEIINIALLFAIVSTIYLITSIQDTALFALGYLLSTFYITPDLDTDSKPYRRWRWLRILWWPYKTSFTHRGKSHHPIWGPISLMGYSFFFIGPIMYLTSCQIQYVLTLMVGMTIAIELHILTDKVR